MSIEITQDASKLAVFIVKNKADVEGALYGLADSMIEECGTERAAYLAVAEGLGRVLGQRRGWLAREREQLVGRVMGDMRELQDLPRVKEHPYAQAMVQQMLRSFPMGGVAGVGRVLGIEDFDGSPEAIERAALGIRG